MDSLRPFYPPGHTALLLVDPYNDSLSDGGKLWPRLAEVAVAVDLLPNLRRIRQAIRCARWPLFFVPHHRAQPSDFDRWQHPTPSQKAISQAQAFLKNGWGGQWHPDFMPASGDTVATEHWGANGFVSTDLDLLLKQQRISHVVMVGLIANLCVETTARHASELGYHVTLVTDATAALSHDAMFYAHEINGPTYAHALLTTREFLARVPFTADP
ncbi:isochorismatase family cysteine hydrolase [Xanthomonas sp. NCPPB 2654]|uniref:isochorismatase family cysteine hydrolase n=1 Tax=unclassified Xanthomonas TaxID=2643310 RepID=UPI0021DFD76B|nr:MULTISPECIES: isochorismatase family cysteine hydrolase [unclassified Xanthomonas]MDL5365623.1 isochorismatase family cysteine hydrolase [Xanthomonas sp. NCPPB 2654]UYC22778.1 cysteine hydrolase [Xanthomonas sp. CFBP 8443]